MTNEEYCEIMDNGNFFIDSANPYDMKIKEALEKQIPTKPYLEGDGYADGEMVYDVWRCPNCDKAYELDYDNYDYCPNCGQRIDWSESEVEYEEQL